MELTLKEAKENFDQLVQLLIDGKEESITIFSHGVPLVRLLSVAKKNNKRIGIAKQDMDGFDISLEELDSIPAIDFGI